MLGRLVRYLIQQSRCILFQFESVGGLHQGHFLAWYNMLRGDIPADEAEYLARGQLVLLPLVYLFPGGIFRWLLVTEFRDQCLCLVDMPVQLGVSFISYMYLASLYSNTSSSSLSIRLVSRIRSKRILCFISLASRMRSFNSDMEMNSSAL